MNDFLALRNVAAVAAIFAAMLLLLWMLIGQGITTFLVPPPDNVSEDFLRALSAHNYGAAHEYLSEELSQQVREEDLRTLMHTLEQTQQSIEEAHGREAQEQASEAQATVSVTLGNQQTRDLTFPLTQEHGEWKIDALDPLNQLAGR